MALHAHTNTSFENKRHWFHQYQKHCPSLCMEKLFCYVVWSQWYGWTIRKKSWNAKCMSYQLLTINHSLAQTEFFTTMLFTSEYYSRLFCFSWDFVHDKINKFGLRKRKVWPCPTLPLATHHKVWKAWHNLLLQTRKIVTSKQKYLLKYQLRALRYQCGFYFSLPESYRDVEQVWWLTYKLISRNRNCQPLIAHLIFTSTTS